MVDVAKIVAMLLAYGLVYGVVVLVLIALWRAAFGRRDRRR